MDDQFHRALADLINRARARKPWWWNPGRRHFRPKPPVPTSMSDVRTRFSRAVGRPMSAAEYDWLIGQWFLAERRRRK